MDNNYKVNVSIGNGKWANIPWVSISNSVLTTGTKNGIYIVLLFCKDMSGFYLSLNQGCTDVEKKYGMKKGYLILKKTRDYVIENYSEVIAQFSLANINLKVNKEDKLGRSYQEANIVSRYYSLDELPNIDIIADINDMLKVYKKISDDIDLLKLDNIRDAEAVNVEVKTEKELNIEKNLKTIHAEVDEYTIYDNSEDLSIAKYMQEKIKKENRKINYEQKQRNNKLLGEIGEKLVLKYERERLKKLNIEKEIVHCAIYDDTLGYDILSFNEDGLERYIEVKATTNLKETPIDITQNEFDRMIELQDSYYIYRVYEIDSEKKTAVINVIDYQMLCGYEYVPTMYKIYGADKKD